MVSICRLQHGLEVSTKQAIFSDTSVNDTIRTCIVMGNNKDALRVKAEFKVVTDVGLYMFGCFHVKRTYGKLLPCSKFLAWFIMIKF